MNQKQLKTAIEIGGNDWWLDGISYRFMGHGVEDHKFIILDEDGKIYLVNRNTNYWETVNYKDEKFLCSLEQAKKIMMLEKFR